MEETTGNVRRKFERIVAGTVLAGGVAMAGSSVVAVTAHAQHGPPPLNHWPSCTEEHPQGNWCPGQPLPPTGNHITNQLRWDNNVCHTYYYVNFGTGNVASNIWDGPNPPPLAGQ
jgi:hypothetical protein